MEQHPEPRVTRRAFVTATGAGLAALLYGIPRIVVGEHRTFQGPERYLAERGVELTVVDDARCVELMRAFIAARPELWDEDIGV